MSSGSFFWKREAPARLVELVRGQAEVEQDGGGTADAGRFGVRAHVLEAALAEPHLVAEAREPPARALESLGVAVDPEQARALSACFQQPFSVSAHADCPVHHPAPASGAQEKRHFVHQHREVRVLLPLHC